VIGGYTATDCGYGRETVTVRLTNLATNLVEVEQAGLPMGTGSATTPQGLQYDTPYREDVEVHGAFGELLTTATSQVTTPSFQPNCATISNENLSTGYWGIYAAVWVQYQVLNCGYGNQQIRVWAQDTATGSIDYDVTTPTMSGLFDFEGLGTKYDTDYEIHVEVHGITGETLTSSSSLVHTPMSK